MLTLISATPGSGKTLKAVELIYEHLNKGYVVYSNILGLKVPGVIKIDSDCDWRDLDHFRRTNPGMEKTPIAVFYDEAHEHPAFSEKDLLKNYYIDRTDYDFEIDFINIDDSLTATQKKQKIDDVNKRYKRALDDKKESIRDIGYALSMHRHFGFDIFLITQSPKKLAAHILADVGTQLHLRRVFKMKRATIYEFPEAHATVYKSIRDDAINKTIWKFPKHLYGSYTSTEVDTHKSSIPLKYIVILLLVFVVAPAYVFRSFYVDPLFSSSKEEQKTDVVNASPSKVVEQKKEIPKNQTEDLQNHENLRVSMVIESSSDCYAKNSYGEILDISIDECRMLSKKNTRIPLSRMKRETLSELPNSHSDISNDQASTFDPTQPAKNI